MLFSTSTLAIVGGILGALAGLLMVIFHLSAWTAVATEQTADLMGVLAIVLSVVVLVAVAVSDQHHTVARGLYLLAGVLGFVAAGLLWIPAGLLMILAGLTGFLTTPEETDIE